MHRDAPSELNLRRRALRAAVLASSVALAALLVLRAGGVTGCDGPASPQQPAPIEAAKRSPEPNPAPAQPRAPAAGVTAPEPAPPLPGAADAGDAAGKDPGADVGIRAPSYLPASKAGVFLEHSPPPPPPAREPAVQQEAQPSEGQVAPR